VVNSTEIPAVFDCNILIQAAANSRNSASACFRLVEAKAVKLFVSEKTLRELEDVLNRDYIKERFKYTNEVIKEFLDRVRNVAVIMKNVPKVFSLSRDVNDEEYINLAVEAEALYIVTRDNDLLHLMTGYDVESKEFRQKTRPLKIVEPLEFLKIVEQQTKNDLSVKP
jgi:putative PIN family toxin of toxin-antitoxin system